MNEREIYAKTEAGREEMRTRALQLSGALRTVLLLVDGQRSVAQLKELMTGGKAPPDALEQLLTMGLISLQGVASGETRPAPPPALPVPPAAAPMAPTAPTAPYTTTAPSPVSRLAPLSPRGPVTVAPSMGGVPPGAAALAPGATDGAQRFNRLYTLMNEIVSDYLGLRGYFMQLKIEKCSSAEELLALQEELGAALAKGHGRDVAAELINRIQAAA